MKKRLGDYIQEYSVRNKSGEDIPVYSITNSQGFCRDYFSKEVASKDKTTYKIVPRGCFAYNPSRINVGSVDWQRDEERVIVSPLYNVFSVSPEIDQQYLYYYLKSSATLYRIKEVATGSVRDNLRLSMLYDFMIELPSLDVQRQIVSNLDLLASIIRQRNQQLTKLDELIKARFVEMFGDPVKNTMDWEIKSLSELGELNRGVSKARPRNSPELLGGPYPLIQTGEVANAKTYITSFNSTYSEKGLAQSKMWPKGTLCITIAANIAQTSILTFDACFPDSVVGFISRNMTNELFIHYWFSFFQKILDEQAPQVAQKNINLKILSELNVIVPPLSLQNQFAAFVAEVDKSKVEVQKALDQTQLLFDSLMQQYFG